MNVRAGKLACCGPGNVCLKTSAVNDQKLFLDRSRRIGKMETANHQTG